MWGNPWAALENKLGIGASNIGQGGGGSNDGQGDDVQGDDA